MGGLVHREQADVWARRAGALAVALVAVYASYHHQRSFALHAGADVVTASLWPLSVDGLLVLASVGLLRNTCRQARRARTVVWLAFLLGIGVSLAANIAAAPALSWQAVLVAGWPPISLLLAVELLSHRDARESNESPPQAPVETMETPREPRRDNTVSAEELMWTYYQREQAEGRIPSGAELDRVAGTNSYGRAVLRRWRENGRIAEPAPRDGIDPPLDTIELAVR
jgi:hypothetical protein